MKLNPVGPNQTELELDGGVIIFFSYSTPVAVFDPGKGALCSNKRYSNTTSRHISAAVQRWGATRTNVDQGVIDQYASKGGVTEAMVHRFSGDPIKKVTVDSELVNRILTGESVREVLNK